MRPTKHALRRRMLPTACPSHHSSNPPTLRQLADPSLSSRQAYREPARTPPSCCLEHVQAPAQHAQASPINLNGPLGPLTHRSTKTATVLIRMPKQLHGVRTADLHLELCRSRDGWRPRGSRGCWSASSLVLVAMSTWKLSRRSVISEVTRQHGRVSRTQVR